MTKRPYQLLIFDWNGTLCNASLAGEGQAGQLYPGVPELLKALAEAGYTLAIATAASKRSIFGVLQAYQLDALFTAYATADDGYYKPQAEVITRILSKTGFKPAEALMIGDTCSDLQCAMNAKVAAVIVGSGLGMQDQLLAMQPLVCLNSVRELPHWLATRS